ncbi:MAG: diacylglycerol kinase family lipid kinase [Firmicutes bacterium]|nr:diacylglycerol kinase family lipid kinase [Bacillota bacterium]
MNVKFIVNPTSGKQIVQENVDGVVAQLTQDGVWQDVDVFYTQAKNEAYAAALELKEDEYDLVVAVGGDGTVHEVVNGILKGGSNIPVAVMPAGTVNDFGHYLQVPNDIEGYCQMVRNNKIIPVDVGQVGDDYFLNVFAGGLFTDISYKVPRDVKKVLGELAYYLAGAVTLPLNIFRSYSLELTYEGKTVEEQVLLFIISNTPSVGGFKQICPQAGISDGLLDVCIIRRSALEYLLPLFFRVMKGEHIDSPHVSYFQTDYLEIRRTNPSGGELSMDMDGEQKGSLPAVVKVVPGALRMLVP